ncbi:MAG TPA: glycosyltransferase family 4 protein [Rhodanobacter sp.]|nr:glycosyltransferase family 4 protein [Rhodanobacter sp.]
MSELAFVVPAGIDDAQRPSGGNLYDQHVRDGLRERGWQVREIACPGDWPAPDAAARAWLACGLAELAPGTTVLMDGLIACCVPAVLAAHASRLPIIVLLHMPLGVPPTAGDAAIVAERERQALACARRVIVTSAWTGQWARAAGGVAGERIVVALPGVDAAPRAAPGMDGTRLLCVAAITLLKGHDVLLDALAMLRDATWQLACVGSAAVEPGFAQALRRRAADACIADRIVWHGVLHGAALERVWARSDLLVLASRKESYGMVVAEALVHGMPVIACGVGGVPEALGRAIDGALPGMLVPPNAPGPLAQALRQWLADPALRERWRMAASSRSAGLPRWRDTLAAIEAALPA